MKNNKYESSMFNGTFLEKAANDTAREISEFRSTHPNATFSDWKRCSFWKDLPYMLVGLVIAIVIFVLMMLLNPIVWLAFFAGQTVK